MHHKGHSYFFLSFGFLAKRSPWTRTADDCETKWSVIFVARMSRHPFQQVATEASKRASEQKQPAIDYSGGGGSSDRGNERFGGRQLITTTN